MAPSRPRRGPWRAALAPMACGVLAATSLGCSDESIDPLRPGGTFGPLGERDDLPVDEQISLDNLQGPVDVVHDEHGRPHVYATSLGDAMRVQGWLIARDRTLQLELLRRLAEGRVAALFGDLDPSLIDDDIAFRHIGLARVAEAQYQALASDDELRLVLDAYADGVSQLFRELRSGARPLPAGITNFDPQAFTDWSGVDSLAIGRLQTYLLSYDADQDLDNEAFFTAARAGFSADASDPAMALRAGIERDLFRFAPADPATTATGYPTGAGTSTGAEGGDGRAGRGDRGDSGAHQAVLGTSQYVRALARVRSRLAPDGFGSNNWAVAPKRSASGLAMVASDPHLPLTAPAIFWPVSIDVTSAEASTNVHLGGVAFAGIPGIILGHNAHVAWGGTVAGYDVSDAYAETLDEDGTSVLFDGKQVPLTFVEEVIEVAGGEPYVYEVAIVPHHGPIVPVITDDHRVAPLDPAAGAVSIRWTGLEATHEIGAVVGLLRARDVDEARAALEDFGVGAQNWMLGDTSGHILWTSHAHVPIRDPRAFDWNASTYTGTLPCMVLPGDGSSEWLGHLPSPLVPWEKDPLRGWLATANNDPIGDTLDNDPSNDTLPDGTPMFLGCSFDIGFREGRIQARLDAETDPLTIEDLASIQADARSAMGARLTPHLLLAIDRAQAERASPGSDPSLAALVTDPSYLPARIEAVRELLAGWEDLGYQAAAGVDLDTNQPLPADDADARASQATMIFNAWLVRVLRRTFGDELARLERESLLREIEAKALLRLMEADPATLATYDPATLDSAVWDDLDTPEVESRHQRMIRALLDALALLEEELGDDPAGWRWGLRHTVRFAALVPLYGKLSIPPSGDDQFPGGFPRHGDNFAVDSSDYDISVAVDATPSFSYAHGPAQRFVVEMDPSGPRAWNALPGGAVWDHDSPHFADEAELWRRNQTHPVPFLLEDVIEAAEKRTVFAAP